MSAALAGYFDEIMLQWPYARVVKLVYTYALGAYAARRAGSSPVAGTTAEFLAFKQGSKRLFPEEMRPFFIV